MIPVLLDGVKIENIPSEFTGKSLLIGLNALNLPFELSSEAIDTLFERYICQPTIESLEVKTADEYFKSGEEARRLEDWTQAEREYEKAVALRRRPEY